MHICERILLYVVALALAGFLLWNDSPSDPPAVPQPGDTEFQAFQDSKHAARRSRENETDSQLASSDSVPSDSVAFDKRGQREITLTDRQGRRRLELKLGREGQPQLALNDSSGKAVITLQVESNGTGQIALNQNHRRAVLRSDDEGQLTFMLKGDHGEDVRLSLSRAGEAEIIAKGRTSSAAWLRTHADGGAEIQVTERVGSGGPGLTVHPSGEAAIGITDAKKEYGPVMHLFEDGLGQFIINGRNSQSGPTLIRTPDGTSIVSVRYGNGQPAASMVGSPNGASVLAVTNHAGSQQAAMRSDRSGKVTIGVSEKMEEPPKPKKKVNPLRLPNQEIIRTEPVRPQPAENAVALDPSVVLGKYGLVRITD